MKKFTALIITLLFSSFFLYAQTTTTPFQKLGYDVFVGTSSKGEYAEFHDLTDVVEIGSVLYNTKTKEIVQLLDEGESTIDASTSAMSIDPHCERYYWISPYAYAANNPIKFIDPDGRKLKIANNAAGAMENLARIAATSLGGQVASHLIDRNETYSLNSTFWTSSSSYNPKNREIDYVANPWYSTIPGDGGALTSMTAMAHEMFHGFDHSNPRYSGSFANEETLGYARSTLEGRAVSFANYMRSAYSLYPLRNQYGNLNSNFHQFSSNKFEKITDFTSLGNNDAKTSYGFSYTHTTYQTEGKLGGKTNMVSQGTYYIVVSTDKDNNATYKIYNNEEDYRKATQNW